MPGGSEASPCQTSAGSRPEIAIYGTDWPTPDGTCIRDYIHVADLADAHVRALKYLMAGNPSVALNLGTGEGHSVRAVIDTVEQVTGREPASLPLPLQASQLKEVGTRICADEPLKASSSEISRL